MAGFRGPGETMGFSWRRISMERLFHGGEDSKFFRTVLAFSFDPDTAHPARSICVLEEGKESLNEITIANQKSHFLLLSCQMRSVP